MTYDIFFPLPFFFIKFGRRKPLIFGGLWQSLWLFVFAAAGTAKDPMKHGSIGALMIVSACLFILGYASTWAPYVFFFDISMLLFLRTCFFFVFFLLGVFGLLLEKRFLLVLELNKSRWLHLVTGFSYVPTFLLYIFSLMRIWTEFFIGLFHSFYYACYPIPIWVRLCWYVLFYVFCKCFIDSLVLFHCLCSL